MSQTHGNKGFHSTNPTTHASIMSETATSTEQKLDDLESLTSLYESAITMPDHNIEKPTYLRAVGIHCYSSNKQLKSLYVNELSIQALQRAIALSHDDQMVVDILRCLGDVFDQQFELSGQVENLTKAISVLQEGLNLTPENDPSIPHQLTYLGSIFTTRFDQTEELQDITEAVNLRREAAFLTPERSRPRFETLFNLSSNLRSRFDYTHELQDIDEAIEVMQDLVENLDHDHPHFPLTLNNLACCFMDRYELTGDLNDILRSIDVHSKAVDYRPNDVGSLTNLGNAHQAYFTQTGEFPHIHMAIEAQRKALSLAPPGHHFEALLHINLGVALGTRFLAMGNNDDLEEAIDFEQRAIQLSRDDDPSVRRYYSNLGNLYYYRAGITQDLHDMREGVRAHREGAIRTPIGHRDLPGLLNNLGNSWRRVYRATNNESDLTEAITAYKESVSLAHDCNAEHMDCLGNLGGALCDRFLRTNQRSDLDESITALRKAITLCPPNHTLLPNNLSQLAFSLRTLFEEERQLEILDEAMSVLEWAINILPEGNAQLPSLFNELADLFYIRYKTTESNVDLERAVSLYRESTQMPASSPRTRIRSAQMWGNLSLIINLEQSFEAFQIIFNEVIPKLAWIGRTIDQRYNLLSQLASIVSGATAVAIKYGQLHMALEWLEQGRSIVWNQVNNFHAPLDDIRSIDPVLCHELEKTAIALQEAGMRGISDSLGVSMAQNMTIQDEVRRHQALAKKWDSLLSRVRELSGFQNFLCPVPFTDLVVNLPPSGLVIILNSDPFSTDVMVLSRDLSPEAYADIFTVSLPLSYERAVFLRERLYEVLSDPLARTRTTRKGRLATSSKLQISVKDVLRELWYEVVKPILDQFHLKRTSNPPRIWWCPTGPLAFLPIHAAGDYYCEDKSSNIMEYAISSYIPTITALTQSLFKHHDQRQSQVFKGMLAISEPQAPGLPHIPNTANEIRAIERIFHASSLTFHGLEGMEATVKSVSDAMPLHNWIHLSCHALQNDKPLDSAFYLHDGQLTLRDIIKSPLPYAQFAFLSACETGKGDKKLSEEAIHLAAGMLTAGYTSVVATMWSISDEYAPHIAGEFYTHMLKEEINSSGGEPQYPDCTRAAAALHHSIASFRQSTGNDSEESLLLWVPYIHVGI